MKERHEQLSALVDNELQPDELARFMEDVHRDPLAEGEALQRYQLIGKTLRGELDAAAFIDVSASVQRAIAEEQSVSNVVSLPARRGMQRWMRPAAGLAIAASVAMVTVLSVRLVQQTEPDATAPVLAASTTVAAPVAVAVTRPVNELHPNQLQVAVNGGLPKETQTAPVMNDYLLRHSGAAGQATLQGVMPYARAVSFEDAR